MTIRKYRLNLPLSEVEREELAAICIYERDNKVAVIRRLIRERYRKLVKGGQIEKQDFH